MKNKTTKKGPVAEKLGSKKLTQSKQQASGKSKWAKNDIIQIILQDHKPLKELIETLKDPEVEFLEKKPVFEEFAPLFLSHANPEQDSLYVHMKDEDKLRSEGFEGDTEHALASQLIDEINETSEEDEWMAKVKVLAELVEHHLKEEENEMFPEVKKQIDAETRVSIGEEYLRLRDQYRMDHSIPGAQAKKSTEVHVH